MQSGLMLVPGMQLGRTHIKNKQCKTQVQHGGAHRNTTQTMQLSQDLKHRLRAGGLHRQEPCNTQIAIWARHCQYT